MTIFSRTRRGAAEEAAVLEREADATTPPAPAQTAAMKRPEPVALQLADPPDLSEYEEVAAVLGFYPPQLAEHKREIERREVLSFMLDNGFPVYDNKQVHDFMSDLAEKADRVFVWAPLDSNPRAISAERNAARDGPRYVPPTPAMQQASQMLGASNQMLGFAEMLGMPSPTPMAFDQIDQMMRMQSVQTRTHGQTVGSPYSKAVPLHILKRAVAVKKRFPEAKFYVSDYAVHDPDPFIMVRVGNCEPVVFGVWDEPSFGDIKKRDREER
jgi:hypothetical protein